MSTTKNDIIKPNFAEKSSDLPPTPKTARELIDTLKEAGAITDKIMSAEELEKKRNQAARVMELAAGLLTRDAEEFEQRGIVALQSGNLEAGHGCLETARCLRVSAAWMTQKPAQPEKSPNAA